MITDVETLGSQEPPNGLQGLVLSPLSALPSGVQWWLQGASSVPLQLVRVAQNRDLQKGTRVGLAMRSHLGFHSDVVVL